jgi:hypothetical protein
VLWVIIPEISEAEEISKLETISILVMEKYHWGIRTVIVLFLVIIPCKGNAQWTDNFSDGNFNLNPVWFGDSSKFIVNDSGQLQLDALPTDISAQLAVKSKISFNAVWTFKVQMDFNPSSGNYSKIYLMSDTSDFRNSVNGYFVRIGYTSDDVSLFKQTNTSSTLLIDGKDKMLNSEAVNVRIKVTVDSIGNWQLFCDTTGNEQYSLLGTAQDNTIKQSSCFGLQCIFSSSRADKFYFDDFTASGGIYSGAPVTNAQPEMYDIVFNEIMADPTPPGALPEAEYMELYNCSKKDFSTQNWIIQIGTTKYHLPDLLFKSGEFLVITSKNEATQFSKWCTPLGLFSSSSVLTNTGQYLELRNANGSLVTWLEYADTWYADDFKADGGWSMEQMDPQNPCGGRKNWKASMNKEGGTPGNKNSVYQQNPDIVGPQLNRIKIVNDSSIQLIFNEPLSVNSINPENFSLGTKDEKPLQCSFFEKGYTAVHLQFPSKLSDNIPQTLKISSSITDCAANNLEHDIDTIVAKPRDIDSLDVIINEVLFHSKPYCPDYVEIYNRSEKILNSADLLIGINDGTAEKIYRIAGDGFLFYPCTYLLLSSNPEKLTNFYTLKNDYSLVTISDLTSLDDNAGTINIKTLDYKITDAFSYNKLMHLATLRDPEGVSLERINPQISTYRASNWHSAAETSGYGTPGYQNSQYMPESKPSGSFTIENELFSPDNDGYNDVLPIHYKLEQPNTRISAWVFDLTGRRIKELMNNVLPETSGTFYWDGFSDKGTLCAIGMYLIFIRAVNNQGNTEEYKLPCVLAIKR